MLYISIVYLCRARYCVCGCIAEIRKSNQRLNNIMVAWENEENNGRATKKTITTTTATTARKTMHSIVRPETRYWGRARVVEINRNIEWRVRGSTNLQTVCGFVDNSNKTHTRTHTKIAFRYIAYFGRDYFTSSFEYIFYVFFVYYSYAKPFKIRTHAPARTHTQNKNNISRQT